MTPRRIQLSRKKGWRMPSNTVKVDRSTRWGNPWRLGDNMLDRASGEFRKVETIADAIQAFRQKVDYDPDQPMYLETEDSVLEISGGYDDSLHVNRRSIRRYLAGKNLACWCALDQPCHADVLLEFANADPVSTTPQPADGPRRSTSTRQQGAT